MKFYFNFLLKSIVTASVAAMLFSCEGKLQEVRKWEMTSNAPQAIGKGINLFYTDSGKVKAHLKSPHMLDFSNQQFPYREFPNGLKVEFFNEKKQKSTVKADYAIIYEQSGLIDLRKNVKIKTSDSTILKTDQLYWDQNREWIFTDSPFTLKMANGTVNKGQGFDSNQAFDNFVSRSNIGVQVIEEKNKDSTDVGKFPTKK
ncbi:MAG TPA: LPS export ABC transporter periplasmic protein LptC [Flavobacteriaceae bacterium]|nr:LPS export ABC transporter periplasmic protein LptC [Flavobacteriaceae bacterium]